MSDAIHEKYSIAIENIFLPKRVLKNSSSAEVTFITWLYSIYIDGYFEYLINKYFENVAI